MRRTNSGAARNLSLANPAEKAASPGRRRESTAAKSTGSQALSRVTVALVSVSRRPLDLPAQWADLLGDHGTLTSLPAIHVSEVNRRGLDSSGVDVILMDARHARPALAYRGLARLRDAAGARGIVVLLEAQELSAVPVLTSVGAADFVVSGATREELAARLRKGVVRGKRGSSRSPTIETAPGIHLHWRMHEVTFEGTTVALTLRELQLLAILLERAGEVMTSADLARVAWGDVSVSAGALTTTYVCSLRKKLAWFGGRFGIQTVRGVGCKFVV
jgi:DNA-binding response OmpR family regulator